MQNKLKMAVISIVSFPVLIGAFQNCSKRSFTGSTEESSVAPFSQHQPSLAVRAISCASCHLKSSSTVITDFGYLGDGHGRDYYFGRLSPQGSRSPYNDVNSPGALLPTINFQNVTSEFVVPKAPAPESKVTAAIDSLAKYIESQLALSTVGSTSQIKVKEQDRIYIGAPAGARILSAFEMTPASGMKYVKDSEQAKSLFGISFASNVYRNIAVVRCEGDLAINGTLYLNNLQLESATGCRLYVTGSVFIYGPIQYINATAKTNLQITSARAIAMGLGSLQNGNATYCETGGWYQNAAGGITSSLRFRLDSTYGFTGDINGTFMRDSRSPAAIMLDIYNEALQAQSAVGELKDASCRSEGRDVAYSRLLLNAPQVHSRYRGNFNGVIIAEYALMSLGQFVYQFDPVFADVAVLPKLKPADYLDIQ